MPRIFDNMQTNLLPELRDTLDGAVRADFCELSLVPAELPQAISELYRDPLRQSAIDVLDRCLKEEISDRQLVDLVSERRLNDLLCIISEDGQESEPQIICSLGLFDK